MSFPYTLDLAFCSEKATVDSLGRVSFINLENTVSASVSVSPQPLIKIPV